MGEVQRQALARDLARQLPLLELDALRLVDHVVTRLRLGRERYGDLDLAAPRDWGRELAEEQVDALIYAAARELAAQDKARAELHEQARAEMLDADVVRATCAQMVPAAQVTFVIEAAQTGRITSELARELLDEPDELEVGGEE